MFPKTIIPESHPNIVLVKISSSDYVAFEVIDASNMTHEEEVLWKQNNVNYAVTEPLSKYFSLKVDEIILKNPTDITLEMKKKTQEDQGEVFDLTHIPGSQRTIACLWGFV